jgi:hypothetical protein
LVSGWPEYIAGIIEYSKLQEGKLCEWHVNLMKFGGDSAVDDDEMNLRVPGLSNAINDDLFD